MKSYPLFRICMLIFFCFGLLTAAAAAAPVKVAVLPFTIHADKDYAFLRQGIVEMLASRLSAPGKVMVIDPTLAAQTAQAQQGQSGEALARKAGAELKADYAVQGTVTILGENVSIDALGLDLNGGRPTLTFFKQAPSLGGVIPQIDRLAEEISTQLLGLPSQNRSAGEGAPANLGVKAPPAPAPAPPDLHEHPDKLLRKSPLATTPPQMPAGQATDPAAGPRQLNPAFETVTGTAAQESATYWKSRNYNYMINAVDVGDVDRDGQLETVVAAPDKIYIYRFTQGRQQSVAEIDSGRLRNISVSVGDINGNGTPEIFVTAFTLTLNQLESYVLEFDGRDFRRIAEKNRFYYSVVRHPTRGSLLLGQRQASSGSTPFEEPIYEIVWKGAAYEPEHQLLPGGKANVLGLAFGDIMNDAGDSFVAFDPSDHLHVLLPNGKSEWKDEEAYGGTMLYFALPPLTPDATEEPFYLPVRLRCVDLDKDGKTEILTFLNEGGTGRGFRVRRYFSKSHIEALAWNGLGLDPLWKARPIPGRIQDILVADFDNDGAEEVLAGVVSKEGAIIFTDAQSALIAYKLQKTLAGEKR